MLFRACFSWDVKLNSDDMDVFCRGTMRSKTCQTWIMLSFKSLTIYTYNGWITWFHTREYPFFNAVFKHSIYRAAHERTSVEHSSIFYVSQMTRWLSLLSHCSNLTENSMYCQVKIQINCFEGRVNCKVFLGFQHVATMASMESGSAWSPHWFWPVINVVVSDI